MDNGVVALDMKSSNNANSPHSPAVTMTTEPPEVGGKVPGDGGGWEERGGQDKRDACVLFFFFFNYFSTPQFGRSSICSSNAQPRRPNTAVRRQPTSPGRWRGSI